MNDLEEKGGNYYIKNGGDKMAKIDKNKHGKEFKDQWEQIEKKKGFAICGAKTGKGTPCAKPSGWGTNHVGTGRCKLHGGASTGVKGNQNARKHGLYSKYIPAETVEMVNDLQGETVADILLKGIRLQFAKIIQMQRYNDYEDSTKTKILEIDENVQGDKFSQKQAIEKTTETEKGYQVQSELLKTQSKAFGTLANMIRQYNLLITEKDLNDLQIAQIEKIKVDIEKTKFDMGANDVDDVDAIKSFIDATRLSDDDATKLFDGTDNDTDNDDTDDDMDDDI